MPYFKVSQRVRDEIADDSKLTARLTAHLSNRDELKIIGAGSNNTIFRVGQTESGLWVALRENISFRLYFKRGDDHSQTYAYIYNTYCLEAEEISGRRNIVPEFCVRIIWANSFSFNRRSDT
ncbi:hypothetical protein COV16_01245 [Candidatus Woesearchaeota archaeon CG10_big_fil_rev_8_21_14_0_10_34_8]|nr:MAG: hypothetical protein COV16_01245 [Candidatus Woesearchaeota archaeon CG10_big_fil_rev_8_21_14_0_10_34_8]